MYTHIYMHTHIYIYSEMSCHYVTLASLKLIIQAFMTLILENQLPLTYFKTGIKVMWY